MFWLSYKNHLGRFSLYLLTPNNEMISNSIATTRNLNNCVIGYRCLEHHNDFFLPFYLSAIIFFLSDSNSRLPFMYNYIETNSGVLAYGPIKGTPGIRNADGSCPWTGRPAAPSTKKYKSAVFRRGARRAGSKRPDGIRDREGGFEGMRRVRVCLSFCKANSKSKGDTNATDRPLSRPSTNSRAFLLYASCNWNFPMNEWLFNVTRQVIISG